jgi:Tfp pilus assembly protein PilF
METIYATVLNNESLKSSRTRRSNVYTSYGYYSINVRGDFLKGRDYLTLALETKPDEPQWWINLIKLHVAMHRHAEAEQRLNEFRSADTHSATQHDFDRLQKAIDEDRMNMMPAAAAANGTATGQ